MHALVVFFFLLKHRFISYFTWLGILQQFTYPTACLPLDLLMQTGINLGGTVSALSFIEDGFYVIFSFVSGAPSC